ncbi:hypothetical protein V2G26_021283 [Clonostachys chloroleuca]
MAQGQGRQAFLDFSKDVECLIEEFKSRVLRLVAQHCAANASDGNETPGLSITPGLRVEKESDKSALLPCPECSMKFNRRNNLERHWPKHVDCAVLCPICNNEITKVQTYSTHLQKCGKNVDAASDVMIKALEQQYSLNEGASAMLDNRLASYGKGRKRLRKDCGAGSKKIQTASPRRRAISTGNSKLNEFATSPTVSQSVNPGLLGNSVFAPSSTIGQSVNHDLFENPAFAATSTTDTPVNPSLLEAPTFPASSTSDPPFDQSLPEYPAFAASFTIDPSVNPDLLEAPTFPASSIADPSIDQSLPEYPAFATSLTIDRSAIPDHIENRSYTADQHSSADPVHDRCHFSPSQKASSSQTAAVPPFAAFYGDGAVGDSSQYLPHMSIDRSVAQENR